MDIRHFGLRLRVGFQLFLALLATAIGIGLVVMTRDAVTSRSVVTESFDTPPALSHDLDLGKGSTATDVGTYCAAHRWRVAGYQDSCPLRSGSNNIRD